jgi:hypothetical protein
VISRRAVSEFPNDNPELHDGLVWVCPEPRGRALPTLRMRPPEGAMPKVLRPVWEIEIEDAVPEPVEALRVEPVRAEAPHVEAPHVEAPHVEAPHVEAPHVEAPHVEALHVEPPRDASPDSPFDRFTAAISRVAMGRGATRAGAAAIALLTTGRVGPESLSPSLLEALVRRRILVAGTGHVTPDFAAITRAWRAVLEGTDADLSACGSTLLDAWAAELLATVMGGTASDVAELRRELRRAGIAAFGLLAVA